MNILRHDTKVTTGPLLGVGVEKPLASARDIDAGPGVGILLDHILAQLTDNARHPAWLLSVCACAVAISSV